MNVLSVVGARDALCYLQDLPFKVGMMAASYDCALVAISIEGQDNDVFIYDRSAGAVRFRFEDHDQEVSALCFSHDSKHLVSCDRGQNVYIFSVSDGSIAGVCSSGIPGAVLSLCDGGFEKDVKRRPTSRYLFAAAGRNFVTLLTFDPATSAVKTTACSLKIQRDFTACVFTPSSQALLVGSSTGDVAIIPVAKSGPWSMASSLMIPGSGGVTSLSTSDQSIAVGCRDGSVAYITVGEDSNISISRRVVVDKFSSVSSVSLCDQGTLVGLTSGEILHVSQDTQKSSNIAQFPVSPILDILSFTDEIFFALSSSQLVSYESGIGALLFQHPSLSLSCAAVSDLICLVGSEDKITGLNTQTGEPVWTFPVSKPSCVQLMRSLKSCVVANHDGELRLYDLRSRDMRLRMKEHAGKITGLEFFSDQNFAITSGRDHNLVSYDLSAGKQLNCHRTPNTGIACMTLRKDQSTVIAGSGKNLFLFDLRVMDVVGSWSHGADIISLFSLENELESVSDLIVGDSEGTVTLFDIRKTGARETGPYKHGGPVTALSASNNNRYDKSIISGGVDNTIACWSLTEGQQEIPAALVPVTLSC